MSKYTQNYILAKKSNIMNIVVKLNAYYAINYYPKTTKETKTKRLSDQKKTLC